MKVHDWNRKDATPEDTIKNVEQILNGLDIHTKFIAEYSYKNFWYSNRLEIEGVPLIGSNGKGVTDDYARASAYGEFMERFQSNFMLNNLYPNKLLSIEKPCIHKNSDKWINYVNCPEKKGVVDTSTKLLQFLETAVTDDFWDIKNRTSISIPYKYVDIICASSGLSAGNTFYEAFCQGLCEILERYVVRCIYYGKYDSGMFRHIDDSVFSHLQSYSMIEAISQKGYSVYVVDCTLNNTLPVLGVFMMDSSKSKYFFKLASDINMDICLQRCITEIFQGCTFDLNFRLNMSTLCFDVKNDDFWDNIDRDYEYTKAIIDGTGKLPNRFINQVMKSTCDIYIFNHDKLSNEKAASLLSNIALKLSDTILVANLTKLGFPTLRIFIPYYSECFFFKNRRLEKVFYLFDKIKKAHQNNALNDREAFDNIVELSNTNPYSYNFNLSKLFGIILNDYEMLEYLCDINILIALLACYHGEFEIAKKYIKRFAKSGRLSARRTFIDEATIIAICTKVKCSDFIDYMRCFEVNEKEIQRINKYYDISSNGFSDIYCNECASCFLKSKCQYSIIAHISHSLEASATQNMKSEFTNFVNQLSDILDEKNSMNN